MRTGYGFSLILAVHSHGEWMQRNERIIYIKGSAELWYTQALSCPAYLNLTFFLAYRVSITDISLQIHVFTLKKNKLCFSSFLISWAVLIFSLCLCIMPGTCFSLKAKAILIQISASSGSLMNIINKAGCYISPLLALMISFACGSSSQTQIHNVLSKPASIKFSKKIIFDTASKDLFKCKQGIGYFHQPLILWFCCLQ